jgi:hypothetical protein
MPLKNRLLQVLLNKMEGFITRKRNGTRRYAVQMGSRIVIYIRSSMKTGPAIQKIIGGIHRLTDSTDIA